MEQDGAMILVVEDDPEVAALVRQLLEGMGYRVVTAANGHLALEACRTDQPSLMIIDLMLPHMDGETFLLHHQREFGMDTPAIILSASAIASEVAQRRKVAAVLPKPFEIELLRKAVRDALAGGAAGTQDATKRDSSVHR